MVQWLIMMAKPIRDLELHYTMIQFLIKSNLLELYYFQKSDLVKKINSSKTLPFFLNGF